MQFHFFLVISRIKKVVGGNHSLYLLLQAGVSQESILGPILFRIYFSQFFRTPCHEAFVFYTPWIHKAAAYTDFFYLYLYLSNATNFHRNCTESFFSSPHLSLSEGPIFPVVCLCLFKLFCPDSLLRHLNRNSLLAIGYADETFEI